MGKRSRRRRPPPRRPAGEPAPVVAGDFGIDDLRALARSVAHVDEDDFGPGPDIADLLAGIVVGLLDDHLHAIGRAVNARLDALHQAQALLAAATLEIGQRVRIGHSVRPLYLHGRTGTIRAWAGKSAVVVLDEPVGRYVTGELRCPPAALEPLGPE